MLVLNAGISMGEALEDVKDTSIFRQVMVCSCIRVSLFDSYSLWFFCVFVLLLVAASGVLLVASALDLSRFALNDPCVLATQDTNFFGSVHCTIYALPFLKKSDRPKIAVISSGWGIVCRLCCSFPFVVCRMFVFPGVVCCILRLF